MLYGEFAFKAKELVIQQLDNGVWYLEPDWREMLFTNELTLENVSDFHLDNWYDVEDMLALEVERRNARDNKEKEVMDWLYELITATVEPAVLQEETDYMKNIVEFMKANKNAEVAE